MAEADVKLRSVCDACTSAKLRCNGKMPCERCLKKGIQCHYQPFKHRGAGGNGKVTSRAHPDPIDTFLDEYERKTWSVFFTLYRSFSKGCSLFWFKQQLFRMLRFLESKDNSDAATANALARLRSWMVALGIDIQDPPPTSARALPHFTFAKANPPSFQSSWSELKNDAIRRNLPYFEVSPEGVVSINEEFSRVFLPSQVALQGAMDEAGGGFLPWSGDLMARLLMRESDLVLYLQYISNTLDAIGKPSKVPTVQQIPSLNMLRVLKRDGQEVLCIVRAVQQLNLMEDDFTFSSLVVFELDQNAGNNSSKTGSVPSKARPFSETSMATQEETETRKVIATEPDDVLPLPQEFLSSPADEEWLDGLLAWASEESTEGQPMSMLPLADDMVDLRIGPGA